jgi:hypothetical protein
MNNDWCVICGDDACGELREGTPVCDFHRAQIDGGYTLDELRAERDDANPERDTLAQLAAEEPRPEDEDTERYTVDRELTMPEAKLALLEITSRQGETARKMAEIQAALPEIEANLKYWQDEYWSAWGALRVVRMWMEGDEFGATEQQIYDMIVREMDGVGEPEELGR